MLIQIKLIQLCNSWNCFKEAVFQELAMKYAWVINHLQALSIISVLLDELL